MSNRVSIHGLTVSVENPKGSTRAGVGPNGSWQTVLAHDYGDVEGSRPGADGDPVDVFLGDHRDSPDAYVVNQTAPDGSFDEHKVMLGFRSKDEAASAYLANYEPGWKQMGHVVHKPVPHLMTWLYTGDLTRPCPEENPAEGTAAEEASESPAAEASESAPPAPAGMTDAAFVAIEDALLIGPAADGTMLYEVVDSISPQFRRVKLLCALADTPNENRRVYSASFLRLAAARANAYCDASPRYAEEPHPPFDSQRGQYLTDSTREIWRHVNWFTDAAGHLWSTVDIDLTTEKGRRADTKISRKEKLGVSIRLLPIPPPDPPRGKLADGSTVAYFDAAMAERTFFLAADSVPNPAATSVGRVMTDAALLVPMTDATQITLGSAALPTTALAPPPAPVPKPKEKKPMTAADLRAQAATLGESPAAQALLDAADALDQKDQATPDAAAIAKMVLDQIAPTLDAAKKAGSYVDAAETEKAAAAERQKVVAIADAVEGGTYGDTARFTEVGILQKFARKVRACPTEDAAKVALADAIESQDEISASVGLALKGYAPPADAGTTGTTAAGVATGGAQERVQVVIEDKDKRTDDFLARVQSATDAALAREGMTPDPALRKANQAKVDAIFGSVDARVGREMIVDSVAFLTAPEGQKDMNRGRAGLRAMTDAGMFPQGVPVTDAIVSTSNILQQPVFIPLVARPMYQDLTVLKYLGAFGPDATFALGRQPGFDGGRLGGQQNLGRTFKFQSRFRQRAPHQTGGRTRNSGAVGENMGVPRSVMSNAYQSFNTKRRAYAFGITKEAEVWTRTGAAPFDLLGENIAENIAGFARETDNLGYFEMVSATLELNCKQIAAIETVQAGNITAGLVQDGIAYGDGTRSNVLDASLTDSTPATAPPQGVACVVQPNCEGTVTIAGAPNARLTDNAGNASVAASLRTPLVPPRDYVVVDNNNFETGMTKNAIAVKLGATLLVEGYLTEDNEIGSYMGTTAQWAADYVRGKFVFTAGSGVTANTNNLTLMYSYATNFALIKVNFGQAGYPSGQTDRSYADVIFNTNNQIASLMGSHPNYMRPDVCLGSMIAASLVTKADIFDKLKSPTGTALIAPTGQTYAEYFNVMYDQFNSPSILGNDALLLTRSESSKFAIEDPLHLDGGFTGYDSQGQIVSRTEYVMNQFETFFTPYAQDRNGVVFNKPSRLVGLF